MLRRSDASYLRHRLGQVVPVVQMTLFLVPWPMALAGTTCDPSSPSAFALRSSRAG